MTPRWPANRRPILLTRSARVLLLAVAMLVLPLVSGCGATLARARISGAQAALAGATRAGADEHAPYEYTASLLYLEKAKELEAYARFGPAIHYGALSEKLAQQAREKATSAERGP